MQPNQVFYPGEVISMADVKVDLGSLGYPLGSYRGLSDTASSVQTYQSTHINLNASGKVSGVSIVVLDQAKKIEDALTTWLNDTEKAASRSAGCVDDCVRSYQENERVSAELFNGHYTPTDVVSAWSGASLTASGKLTAPAAQKTFATVFDAIGMVGNSVSPSYWLGMTADAVLDLILGQGEHDPFAAIGNTIAGDWEPFSMASDTLSEMLDYFKEFGTETKNYWNNVDPDWDGGASNAASDTLGKMGTFFDDASERLTKFFDSYNAVAVGVYDTADTSAGLLRTLVDWGIAAVASTVAGTVAFETVVDPIVGYVAAGAVVLKVLSTVRGISDVFGKVWDFVTLFTSQCSPWLGLVHGLGDPLTIYKPSFSEQQDDVAMTNQDNPKPILSSIPAGSPMDDALRSSLRKMKNDAGPQIRRLIDNVLAGERTIRDLVTMEWFGRRVCEARPNPEAIRKEVERPEKGPGVAGRITERPE